jgi:hypothetical protein
MTEQQVNNLFGGWEAMNDLESIRLYNSLVKLGDSKQLACATAIAEKYKNKGVSETYKIAYES